MKSLLQRGIKCFFPAHVVDGPEDFCFVACGETCGPDVAVAFVMRDVQTVHYGHAASEFTFNFNVHEMLRSRSDD